MSSHLPADIGSKRVLKKYLICDCQRDKSAEDARKAKVMKVLRLEEREGSGKVGGGRLFKSGTKTLQPAQAGASSDWQTSVCELLRGVVRMDF